MTEQEEKPLGFLNKEFKFVGATPPLGFFDPLGFVEKSDEKTIKKFREAELQHGRVAMVSSLILPFLDIVTKQPAINVLRLSSTNMQLVALWLFAMYEGNRILAVYDNRMPGLHKLVQLPEYFQDCLKSYSRGIRPR